MSSSLLLLIESPLSPSTSPPIPPSSSPNLSPSPSSSPLPAETTNFLYSALHRVDNLVRRYHELRTESNSQANILSHLSTRLSLLAHSTLGPSVRTIDYNHILCPPAQRLSLADRMAISLKDNLDRCMVELDSSLTEMELVYMNVDDTLVALCQLINTMGARYIELVRGAKHVQQVYLALVTEVRGTCKNNLWVVLMMSTARFMVSVYIG